MTDDRAPQDTTRSTAALSRRALITGAGAGAAMLTVGAFAGSAVAAPRVPSGAGAANRPAGAGFVAPIGSAPISGYSYRTVNMYEFKPFNPAAGLTWGGFGTYTSGTSSVIRASFDIPAGAVVRDVEYYVMNNSGGPVAPDCWLFTPGQGTISSIGASGSIPPSGGGITATRVAVPTAGLGPYPLGCTLLAGINTPIDGSVQMNGVRIGFTMGNAGTGLLAAPVRAYDSRSTGGKLAAGSTRTITLPASIVVPGVAGVLANITATGASRGGFLKVYPGNAAAPAASALNYGTASIANALTVGVSNTRQIKIYTNEAVHVIVDITGTVS